jgi:hypothetical protein
VNLFAPFFLFFRKVSQRLGENGHGSDENSDDGEGQTFGTHDFQDLIGSTPIVA